MQPHGWFRWRSRWWSAFFAIALLASITLSGPAIHATAQTPTPDNTVGSLGAPPPTIAPTATTAPTATAAATASPTAAAATPTGAQAAPAAATSGTPAASPASDDVGYEEIPNGGGGKNIVKVNNRTDNRLRVRAKIQLNHIPGPDAEPVNVAEAVASCTNCQTIAVALQIDLISRTATTIAPQNAAIALNVKCSHCDTVAKAIQYVVQVDDPTQVPDNVKDLISQMQTQLNAVAHDKDETLGDAETKINGVIGQFTELANSLFQQRDQKTDDDTPGATVPPDAVVLTPTPDATAPQVAATATPVPASPTAAP